MKSKKIKLPDYMTFAICSHNGLWSVGLEEEEKVVEISPYGGVAEYLDHDVKEYDDEEFESNNES